MPLPPKPGTPAPTIHGPATTSWAVSQWRRAKAGAPAGADEVERRCRSTAARRWATATAGRGGMTLASPTSRSGEVCSDTKLTVKATPLSANCRSVRSWPDRGRGADPSSPAWPSSRTSAGGSATDTWLRPSGRRCACTATHHATLTAWPTWTSRSGGASIRRGTSAPDGRLTITGPPSSSS